MLLKKKLKGAAIATAAASLFIAGCATHATSDHGNMKMAMKDGEVHCAGINSCKGKTSCKSAKNDCKGKNNCKGKGWLKATKAECAEKGGTVI